MESQNRTTKNVLSWKGPAPWALAARGCAPALGSLPCPPLSGVKKLPRFCCYDKQTHVSIRLNPYTLLMPDLTASLNSSLKSTLKKEEQETKSRLSLKCMLLSWQSVWLKQSRCPGMESQQILVGQESTPSFLLVICSVLNHFTQRARLGLNT